MKCIPRNCNVDKIKYIISLMFVGTNAQSLYIEDIRRCEEIRILCSRGKNKASKNSTKIILGLNFEQKAISIFNT
jgi:hypothetical protein